MSSSLERSRWPRRSALAAVVLVLVACGWAAVTHLIAPQQAVTRALDEVPRLADVFVIPEDERPPKNGETGSATGEATSEAGPSGPTFLLVGSDSTGEAQGPGDGPWQPGQQRSDVIIVGKVAPAGDVALVSIPRDSWVNIPGRGRGKINASFSYGGPPLLVQTVEAETGVRIDHFAMIDFHGLVAITDAIGGVTVASPRATSYQGHAFVKGDNHLTGEQALAFVRQRKNLPRGDLDRVENQQRFLRAVFGQAISRSVASDPDRLHGVLDAALEHVSVDAGTSRGDLRQIARALGGTPHTRVVAGTAPVSGLGHEGSQSVVYLDETRGNAAWEALRDGDMPRLRAVIG